MNSLYIDELFIFVQFVPFKSSTDHDMPFAASISVVLLIFMSPFSRQMSFIKHIDRHVTFWTSICNSCAVHQTLGLFCSFFQRVVDILYRWLWSSEAQAPSAELAELWGSNQYLMQPEVFPYPFVLIIMHCIFCASVLALAWRMESSWIAKPFDEAWVD